MKKFLTIFLNYNDIHFYKDPGQIPFRFQKNHGFQSTVLCYDNSNNTIISEKYLELIRIKKKKNRNQYQFIRYLSSNAKKISVLNLFHFNWTGLLLGFLYKTINPKGFLYVKLDHCAHSGTYEWEKIWDRSLVLNLSPLKLKQGIKSFLIKYFFVKKVNLWSIEDELSCEYYQNKYKFFKNKLIISYNGHVIDLFKPNRLKSFNEKENLIITVGRLGSEQKATDVLLQAFTRINFYKTWEVQLIGSVEPDFQSYIEAFFNDFPYFKERITIRGTLNKESLFEIYNRAKIFVLPSRWEGFANVFSEAMYFSNAIITTRHVSVKDIVNENMGVIVNKDDVNQLANSIQYLINNPKLNEIYGSNAHEFAIRHLNWDTICNKLYNEMVSSGLVI